MGCKYTIFVMMKATRHWLALSRDERSTFVERELTPLFEQFANVSVRFFDAEAFSTYCSDVAVYETDDLQNYYFLMEAIRDTKVWTTPYFEFIEIIPAIEGGFVEYEANLKT